MSIKLTEKAILATLNMGQYTGKKQDKKAEQTIETTYNAHNAGNYRKATIAKEALDEVSKVVNETRTFFYTHTLPWTDSQGTGTGQRLKTMDDFLEFTAQLRNYERLVNQKADEFTANYPALIDEARNRLNGLFNPKDYPAPDKIREKFYFSVQFDPIPEQGDVRVNLQQDELDKLNADLDARNNDRLAQAMKDPYQRLAQAIKHAQERLSDPKAIFRDSLIDNLVDLIKILPSLNVTNDPTLEALRKEAQERLTKYDAETLREDKTARTETAQQAEALLNKMKGLY